MNKKRKREGKGKERRKRREEGEKNLFGEMDIDKKTFKIISLCYICTCMNKADAGN